MNHSTMLTRCLFLLFLLISLAHGEIHQVRMYSQALLDSNRIIVATPDGFDLTRRGGYPFIMMLHGWSGDETQWRDDSDLQMLADTYQILLVLPDGGYDGWWINNEFQSGRDYETYIHEELKSWVIKEFNGSKKQRRHGIIGLSMGGYGSLIQVLKYPRDYAAAASLSGVLDITIHPESWNIANTLGDYASNITHWEANNPRHLSNRTPPWGQADILVICGRDDFAFSENEQVAGQMKRWGYPVTFIEDAGAHSHAFWKAHVNTAIAFIVDNMNYPKP